MKTWATLLLPALAIGGAATAAAKPKPAKSAPSPRPSPAIALPAEAPPPEPPSARPVLFRGKCARGSGPSACRIVAVGTVTEAGLEPLACKPGDEASVRASIAKRYFEAGTVLDLYARGAPAGSFQIAAAEPTAGCGAAATGARVDLSGPVFDFVALHPNDPVKLGASRFPSSVQPDAEAIAVAALVTPQSTLATGEVAVREVRRLRDADRSVMVVDATGGGRQVVVIAEGNGPAPRDWRPVWSSLERMPGVPLALVDTFDLGADGRMEILLERSDATAWLLLRRHEREWR